jgi:hypothetical protein
MMLISDFLKMIHITSLGSAVCYSGFALISSEMQVSEIRENLSNKSVARPGRADTLEIPAPARAELLSGDAARRFLDQALYRAKNAREDDSNQAISQDQLWIEGLSATLSMRSPSEGKAWCVLSISEAHRNGMTNLAIQRLRACYKFAPYEADVTPWRLSLAMASWADLPPDLQTSALTEVAYQLSNPILRSRMAQQLAFITTALAPEQTPLAMSLLELHGQPVKLEFERSVQAIKLRPKRAPAADVK